jgi:hypothetical protein
LKEELCFQKIAVLLLASPGIVLATGLGFYEFFLFSDPDRFVE